MKLLGNEGRGSAKTAPIAARPTLDEELVELDIEPEVVGDVAAELWAGLEEVLDLPGLDALLGDALRVADDVLDEACALVSGG